MNSFKIQLPNSGWLTLHGFLLIQCTSGVLPYHVCIGKVHPNSDYLPADLHTYHSEEQSST